ncbi:MAG: DNA polymerase III subunit alpha [Actinobacteria bacterium]|nr:DNA polymerase III subunit alpha [Actinomycetota bacterium]
MPYVHLQVASGFSFKYGSAQPNQLVERAATFGMPALALTDRNALAGAIRFTQSCQRAGITPIIGCNLEVAPTRKTKAASTPAKGGNFVENNFSRVTVMATSQNHGWRNLVKMVSGVEEQLLTYENFAQHSAGVLLLLGPNSDVGRALASRRIDQAKAALNRWRELAQPRSIAIEVVSHLAPGEGELTTAHAARSLLFANQMGIPAVISNSVRMLDREDGPVVDILDAARKLMPLSAQSVERKTSEGYLKSQLEMQYVADEISKAAGEYDSKKLLQESYEWAQRAYLSPSDDIGLGGIHLPEAQTVNANSVAEMQKQLLDRCDGRINSRYQGDDLPKAISRLRDELETVKKLGYEPYFLAVADIVEAARSKGIRVAARGSGAGSLICYLLGISTVEPLKHGLLMERFCSPLRSALPDIDIDVESARRLEIYEDVFAKYNKDGVIRATTVGMFETYRARHAIRDVGAAMGLPAVEVDALAKAMPHIRARNINAAIKDLPELRHIQITSNEIAMALGLAQRLDGLPRNISMHPCAVILGDSKLLERAPAQLSGSGYPMLQWDKDDVEAVGLLKLDILGVRMQSAISYSLSEIKRVDERDIDLDEIELDDAKTFELIRTTRTLGIFQIESPGQRELIGKFGPETFNDLIIDISLFRPGPVKSDMITPFLNARQGFSKPRLIDPSLHEILLETQGVVVFHEQVIRIISKMTGVSLAQADEYRRALSNFDQQERFKDWFIPIATGRGYSLQVAVEVWEVLQAFASFGFCKAHAAAFALPTYQSAWLKTHYPAAFIAGILTHDPGMYPKRLLLDEARQLGVELLNVDVNKSKEQYRVVRDVSKYGIQLAFSDLHGITSNEIESIVEGQPYLDISDFHLRARASTKTTESLIHLGAFDRLYKINKESELTRRDLLLHYSDIQKWNKGKQIGSSQSSLFFDAPTLTPSGLPKLTLAEEVKSEIEILGLDVSGHLLSFYAKLLNQIGAVRVKDFLNFRTNTGIFLAGVKVALQSPPVRSGKRTIFLSLEDGSGCSDSTFFESTQIHSARILYNSDLLLVYGFLRRTGARGVSVRAHCAWDLGEVYEIWRDSGQDIEAVRAYLSILINQASMRKEPVHH